MSTKIYLHSNLPKSQITIGYEEIIQNYIERIEAVTSTRDLEKY